MKVVYVDRSGRTHQILRAVPPRVDGAIAGPPIAATRAALTKEVRYWRLLESKLSTIHQARSFAETSQLAYALLVFVEWARFHVSTVVVVDVSTEDNINLLKALSDSPARRLLVGDSSLTERAVRAVHAGYAHDFLAYDWPSFSRELMERCSMLHERLLDSFGLVVRSRLGHESLETLELGAVREALSQRIAAMDWIEHVFIDEPLGALGATADGQLGWICVQAAADVPSIPASSRLLPDTHHFQSNTHRAVRICEEPPIELDSILLQPPVLNARSYGVEREQSPVVLAQELVGRCQALYRRVAPQSASHEGWGHDWSEALQRSAELADAVQRVVAYADESELAFTLVHQVVDSEAFDTGTRAHLRMQIALGRIKSGDASRKG